MPGELLRHCRQERIEPPTSDRVTRMVRSALHAAEENWFAVIAARLEEPVHGRVLGLVEREREVTDALADLLIATVHRKPLIVRVPPVGVPFTVLAATSVTWVRCRAAVGR